MIVIGKNKDRNKFSVRIVGDGFGESLKTVKYTDGCVWDKDSAEWHCPINSLDYLTSKLSSQLFIISLSLQRYIDQFLHNKKELITLKQKTSGITFTPKLRLPLFPYQHIGTKFLYEAGRALLADVVGLGKTPQAIAVCDKLKEDGKIDFTIIIVPAPLKKKWLNEINKFSYNKAIMVESVKDKRYYQYGLIKTKPKLYSFLIINYDLIWRDYEKIVSLINKVGKTAIIGDEIQFIKNSNTNRTKAFISLTKEENVTNLYGLSATYIETGLENLFTIFKAINPAIFGTNLWKFQAKYIDYDYFGGIKGYKNIEDAMMRIDPYVIRREKEKVLEQLPTRVEKEIFVEMSKEQLKHYNEIKAGITASLDGVDFEKKLRIKTADILAQIIYLRQACLSAELLGGENVSTKLDIAIDIVKNIGKEKIVIFCYFKKMIEIIHREFEKAGIKSMFVHGDNCKTSTQKQDAIDKFSDGDYTALIASDALSTGLDIIAASYLMNFDLHYTPSRMEQRNGRIDRVGQKAKKITIITLITEGTIEQGIWNTILIRGNLINKVVENNYDNKRIEKVSIKKLVGLM